MQNFEVYEANTNTKHETLQSPNTYNTQSHNNTESQSIDSHKTDSQNTRESQNTESQKILESSHIEHSEISTIQNQDSSCHSKDRRESLSDESQTNNGVADSKNTRDSHNTQSHSKADSHNNTESHNKESQNYKKNLSKDLRISQESSLSHTLESHEYSHNTDSKNTRESYHTESQTHSIKTESQQSQPDSIQTYYNNNETSYTLQAPHIQFNAPLPQYSNADSAQTTHTQYVDINEKSKHNDTDNVYNAAHTFHNNNTLHNYSHILQTTHTRPYNHSQKINQNGTHTLYNDADSAHNEIYTLQAPHIDYIIFLDSDDYWKPNCLEECLKHSEGVDIVWFA